MLQHLLITPHSVRRGGASISFRQSNSFDNVATDVLKAALASIKWSIKVEQSLISAAQFVPRYLQRFPRRYFFLYKAS